MGSIHFYVTDVKGTRKYFGTKIQHLYHDLQVLL